MTSEEQLNQLSNDLEGYINDYEAAVTNKDNTIMGLIDYVLKRVEISNNSKLNKIIEEMEGMAVFEIKPTGEYEEGRDAFARIAIGIVKKELTKKD